MEDPCFRTNFTKYHCISILGWRVLVSNHISLDQISSHLTTFLSKHGTYPSEIRFWLDLPKSSDISPILCETVHPAQFLPKPTHSHTQARIMLSRPKSAPADLLLMTMCAIPWAHYAHTVSPVHEARIIDRDFITESFRQTDVQKELSRGTLRVRLKDQDILAAPLLCSQRLGSVPDTCEQEPLASWRWGRGPWRQWTRGPFTRGGALARHRLACTKAPATMYLRLCAVRSTVGAPTYDRAHARPAHKSPPHEIPPDTRPASTNPGRRALHKAKSTGPKRNRAEKPPDIRPKGSVHHLRAHFIIEPNVAQNKHPAKLRLPHKISTLQLNIDEEMMYPNS